MYLTLRRVGCLIQIVVWAIVGFSAVPSRGETHGLFSPKVHSYVNYM